MPEAKKFQFEFVNNSQSCGDFILRNANRINRLYYPLFNMQGFMSAVTPELKGDIKTGQNSFLTEPQVTESILQTKNSRNFWLKVNGKDVWSVPGVSAAELAQKAVNRSAGNCIVTAGPGFFSIQRENKKIKLKAEIKVFVPSSGEPLEVSIITVKNESGRVLKILPTAAVPLYGRSADNLRDHRQVTTMLNRVSKDSNGVYLNPTMSFDERGHKPCELSYTAHGFTGRSEKLSGIVSDLETFIGEGGSLEAPELIYTDKSFEDPCKTDGKQVIAGLRFSEIKLRPGQSAEFVVVLGIHERNSDIKKTLSGFSSVNKANKAFQSTRRYWQEQVGRLLFKTNDFVFDKWMCWVSIQPLMRRVFGCSFLPDFGYGRGGRGWRDLWQDCLGILLTNPQDVRHMLLNNIQGVRIDGSNATIIGLKPGEFIADRNNIPRTWMDHGVWPLMTIDLYIRQTGDLNILLEERPFFRDRFSHRCKKINSAWKNTDKTCVVLENGEELRTCIFMHLILQSLTQFYNRGGHGNIRLEGADWNDGLDMADEKGESVPFTAAYAANLERLAEYSSLLEKSGVRSLKIPAESEILFEESIAGGRDILEKYFLNVESGVLKGDFRELAMAMLSKNLLQKSEMLKKHVREQEFIDTGRHKYFNGYYNNHGERLEGLKNGREHMSLTAQVFPVMSGTATLEQCRSAFNAAKDLLRDRELGGFRLNTDFRTGLLDMGRAFSFAYGEKENGSFFSHMIVMFANALYKRGMAAEGYEVLMSIYRMWRDTEKSLFFPCIPEYFDGRGRARYCYITGSASWTVMTMILEVFGIRGNMGKLCFNPKLLPGQFDRRNEISISTIFSGKQINVLYRNPEKLSFGEYGIAKISCDGRKIEFRTLEDGAAEISRGVFNQLKSPVKFQVLLSRRVHSK